ncbi:MAG: thioesterase family protein [Pseudomonadota bacterium]
MHFLTPLTGPALRDAGIPQPWGYGLADKVRFGEIDALQHVNNAAYLRWFENLRINYFRDYGVHAYGGSERPPMNVLKSVTLDFLAEVKLGDSYIMTARTSEMRTSSFKMEYGVFVEGRLTTTGTAVIVTLTDDHIKQPLPDVLRDTFASRDGTTQL